MSYTLNFGTVTQNSGVLTALLGVLNAVTGPSDLLSGLFGVTGGGFGLSGFDPFTALAAGQTQSGLSVSLNTSALGTFSETVTLTPTGSNSGGFSGALAAETLTITGTVACFAEGTLIATPDGPVPVEALAAGGEVVTLLGVSGRIIWIGKRTINCARHPEPGTVWPVRIEAGAFADNIPARALYLSPDHAVYVDGVLIPVKHLENGITIRQVKRTSVTYYHVELAEHDVVLAEGLATESYLDTGDRSRFANGGAVVALYPEFPARTWEMAGCAELVQGGPVAQAVRDRLVRRSGVVLEVSVRNDMDRRRVA